MGTQLPPEKRHSHPTQFLAHVYCGQMAGWIKMPLGTEVNVGPGVVVSDGVAASPPPKRGTAPQFSVHVYCCQTVGWILEDATWYGSRSRSRPHCIGLGLSSPWQGHSSPLFSAHIYCTVAHLSCCWARFLFPSMRLPCMYATVAVKYN